MSAQNNTQEIVVAAVPNRDLASRPELIGLHAETFFQDEQGALVAGKLVSVTKMKDSKIEVVLLRNVFGREQEATAYLNTGEFLPGRPCTIDVYGPEEVLLAPIPA